MRFIYNLGLIGYKLLLQLFALWHHKAKKWTTGQKNAFIELENKLKNTHGRVLWVHCASLGEFEQARPIIDSLKLNFRNHTLLITFFSPSGYENRRDYPGIITSYLPLDSKSNALRFLEIVRPEATLFVKYEFWFHYFEQCRKKNIPILSISARFYASQFYFKKIGFFGKKILRMVDQFYVQDGASKKLLTSISIKNCIVTGDTRFDQVKQLREEYKPLQKLHQFKNEKPLIILGSVWQDDLKVIAPVLNFLLEENAIRLVVAPHEIDPGHLSQIESFFTAPIQRYSGLESSTEKDVILIDNVGILASAYHYADIAYVGGGFATGLHNILEAATYGIPVIYGNKTSRFREASDMERAGGGSQIANREEADKLFNALVEDDNFRIKMGIKAKQFIDESAGATEKILNHISAKKLIST